MINPLVFIPITLLSVLGVETATISLKLQRLYQRSGEPVFIHVALIFLFLVYTFLSGAIGLLLNVNQQTSWIFQSNVLIFSLNYVGIGLVYKSLSHQLSVSMEYMLQLLMLAPLFGLGLLVGFPFLTIPALLSQIIPMLIVIGLEFNLLRRFSNTEINGEAELSVISFLKRVFESAIIIHTIGVFVMLYFVSLGSEIETVNIWVDWNAFDYVYTVLLGVLVLFMYRIWLGIKRIVDIMYTADIEYVFNSLIK